MPPDALLEDAAAGRLPAWAQLGSRRLEHCGRVAALMGEWAAGLGLAGAEATRWRAAGWLHDALKGADTDELRRLVPEAQRELPGKLLHGPAAAARLRADGVGDGAMLDAIANHTAGAAGLAPIGHALYIADFIEPGRSYAPERLAALRARMPGSMPAVLARVVRMKLERLIEGGKAVRPETIALWNETVAAGAD